MVRQLLKYEFKARSRILLLFWGIALVFAGAVRILSLVRMDSLIFNIIYGSSVALLVVGCTALFIGTVILNIIRFYKNLYSSEGYLTFTLPVSEKQHIFVKTFVSFVFTIGALFVCLCAALIALDGRTLAGLFETAGLFLRGMVDQFGTVNFILYIIEGIAAVIAYIVAYIMMFQACLSIGQLARRKKLLCAFGVYGALYVTGQIFGTIFSIVIMQMNMFNKDFITPIVTWVDNHTAEMVHIVLCSVLFLSLVGIVLFYAATYLPMKKKLNLE